MAYEFAKVDRKGPLTIITLNRPEVLNAIDQDVPQARIGLLQIGRQVPVVESACVVGDHQRDGVADRGEVAQFRAAVTGQAQHR